jgi:cytochrome c oxidase subunit I
MALNLINSAGRGKEADMKDPFKIEEIYYDHMRSVPHG